MGGVHVSSSLYNCMHTYIYIQTHIYLRNPKSTNSFHFDLTYSMNFNILYQNK